MDKETIFDVKDAAGRAGHIRVYLARLPETDPDVLNYDDEWQKFVDELAENLSRLRIVDLVASYNPYDKTIDTVWKLIGGYTLSIAQFFTEDPSDPPDDLAVISIHSPEKELLVSTDMTVRGMCDILAELEPGWNETGQPERIAEQFGRRLKPAVQEQYETLEPPYEEGRNRFPVRVGSIVKRIVKLLKIKR